MLTELSQELTFVKNIECKIIFVCKIKQSLVNKFNFNDLVCELLDPENDQIVSELKQKSTPGELQLRLSFKPTTHGIFTLSISFKNHHIPGSPFHFGVLNSNNNKSSLISIKEEPKVQSTPPRTRTVGEILEERSRITESNSSAQPTSSNISIGRGRLLSLLENKRNKNLSNGVLKTPHEPYVPQKRKSPQPSVNNVSFSCLLEPVKNK